MHKRPSLYEALTVIKRLAPLSEDCNQALKDYNSMKSNGDEFLASRMIVDIVDHYYHLLDNKGIAHG